MKTLKNLLLKTIGTKNYLLLVSKLFFILYQSNLLKLFRSFDCHYFVAKLVKKGDTVIDIGANLGYYSKLAAKLVGDQGKVYSVEPVKDYLDVLKVNLNNTKNTTILPFALGESDGKEIVMGIASEDTYRHGLTKVFSQEEIDNKNYKVRYNVLMRDPVKLFDEISKIDYIKCDIEGYETYVITAIVDILKKHKPTLQIEIWNQYREFLVGFLINIGYKAFVVSKDDLLAYDSESASDIIFIHETKLDQFKSISSKKMQDYFYS